MKPGGNNKSLLLEVMGSPSISDVDKHMAQVDEEAS